MAKARSRVAARKIKDKWKSKTWYEVQAPVNFGYTKIAETLADEPDKLVGRIAETNLQELTGDFKQMHVKLAFKISEIEGKTAKTTFSGHTLTSDYVRRMTRRNHSKIDAVADVVTKDGAKVRVKPLGVGDRRTTTAQQMGVRQIMKAELTAIAGDVTLNRFVRDVVDGKVSSRLFKACKPIYPLRRVEVGKTEVVRLPQVEIEEDWSEPEPEPEPKVEEEVTEEATEEEASEEEGAEAEAEEAEEEGAEETKGEGETEEPAEEEAEEVTADEAPEAEETAEEEAVAEAKE